MAPPPPAAAVPLHGWNCALHAPSIPARTNLLRRFKWLVVCCGVAQTSILPQGLRLAILRPKPASCSCTVVPEGQKHCGSSPFTLVLSAMSQFAPDPSVTSPNTKRAALLTSTWSRPSGAGAAVSMSRRVCLAARTSYVMKQTRCWPQLATAILIAEMLLHAQPFLETPWNRIHMPHAPTSTVRIENQHPFSTREIATLPSAINHGLPPYTRVLW